VPLIRDHYFSGPLAGYQLIKTSLNQGLRSFVFQRSVQNLEIKVSDRENMALLGAAALYFDALESRKIEELEHKRKKAEEDALHRARQATLLNEIGRKKPILIWIPC
jgi:hypothetical protein